MAGQPARPLTKSVGRIAALLCVALLLLFFQSVWAAGYRPHRHLGVWHLQQDAAPDAAAAAATTATTEEASKGAQEPETASTPAAPAATPDAAGAAATPAATSPSDNAEADLLNSAAVTKELPEEKLSADQVAQATAEAEDRAAENFLAVNGAKGEPEEGAADDNKAEGKEPDARSAPEQQQQKAADAAAPAAAAAPQPDAAAAAAAAPAGDAAAAAGDALKAEAQSTAPGPLQNMPYDLNQLVDVDALFKAHRDWQTAVLQEKKKGVPAMKVETGMGHGLGNRLPGIGTGFVLAVLTGRLFFLQSAVHEHLQMPLPCVWQDYESLYEGVDRCDLGHFAKFVNPDLKFCGGPGESKTAPLIMQPCQFDYMLPMFQINPTLKPFFDKFFPDGEVYSKVAKYLFQPKPVLLDALKPYEDLSKNCLVGMHLRTKKPGTSAPPEQFAAIARAIAVARPGNVFVAADADLYKQLQDALPGREVWWNKDSAAEHQSGKATAAGNPGSELTAITDLMLLSKCKNIILTPSSSIGGIAAAIAGVPPVFATHGPHTEPYTNPWFWKSVTSEPCFVKACTVHHVNTELAQRFKKEHPLYVYHSQCHVEPRATGVPEHSWECTNENCREYRK